MMTTIPAHVTSLKYSQREHTHCSDQRACALFLPRAASGCEAAGERSRAFIYLFVWKENHVLPDWC